VVHSGKTILSGFQHLSLRHFDVLRGKRVALVINHTSTGHDLQASYIHLLANRKARVVRIFSPEHGLWGTFQDQEKVETTHEPQTGLEIVSLYGGQLSPTAEMIQDCDLVMFDIQDIGVRYYTYIYTMLLTMEACAAAGKEFLVLDRPNPLGGLKREGNVLDPAFKSFVGLYPLPVVHGLTAGEIARFINERERISCQLEVVPCQNWQRHMLYDGTGLVWVLPSPNMPTLQTAVVYPGSCLFEATNVSEGRGTTLPFELIGAPWINPWQWVEALNTQKLSGVLFRPLYFRPMFNKYMGQACGGVQIHVINRIQFDSYLTGIIMIKTLFDLYPDSFSWKQPPYEFEKVKMPIDILCGSDKIRLCIEQKNDVHELAGSWQSELQGFSEHVRPFLLYT